MKISPQQYAQALLHAMQDTAPKDHDRILDNLVQILAQNGDLDKYELIEVEYKLLEAKAKGISQAEITVANDVEINSDMLNELNKIIGTPLEIQKKVDADIVGGVVVRVDDTLIDASIKTQLKNLNNELRA